MFSSSADITANRHLALLRHSISASDFGIAKPDVRIFHAGATVDACFTRCCTWATDATLDAQARAERGACRAVWINSANHLAARRPRPTTEDSLTALCRLLPDASTGFGFLPQVKVWAPRQLSCWPDQVTLHRRSATPPTMPVLSLIARHPHPSARCSP